MKKYMFCTGLLKDGFMYVIDITNICLCGPDQMGYHASA